MGHERVQIAGQMRLAALGQRQQIVPSGFWFRTPILDPRLRRSGIAKTPGRHCFWHRGHFPDAAGTNANQEGAIGRPEQAIDVEQATGADQFGI
jgi:hypothetical protein